jgi:amino acid adenylation domain-containing protein
MTDAGDEDVYVFPMSFAQQRLWFLDQLEPNGSAYAMPAAVRLSGRLDVERLKGALAGIVARHEALRTVFRVVDGEPSQVIAGDAAPDLPLEDLSALSPADQETEVRRRLDDDIRRPFDLARGPLLRTRLLRLAEDRHVLIVVLHHIVSDGWSMGVFVREMTALYAGRDLPDLPIQYADYAVWQRETLAGERLEALVAHWCERLAGAPGLLELPADRSRPPSQTFGGAEVPVSVGRDLTDRLLGLGRARGATPLMVLITAFAVLLARLSGQNDVVIGTPIAGRTRAEVEPLIGFFVNTLALRFPLSPDESFESALARTREAALEAYAHQELPFERLVEALNPDRALNHSPVFQAMFILQNAPAGTLDLPGLTVESMATPADTAKYDVTLTLAETDGGLDGSLEYNTRLFDRETAEAFVRRFAVLLSGIAADPAVKVGALPLVSPAERERLVALGRGPVTPVPEAPFFTRIAEQAARTPDAVAIATLDGRTTTYGELEARANRLAHALHRLGAGPGERVALFVERGPDLVAGLLGILKSGAAYIPLDPVYPAERIALMLEDGQPKAIVTEAALSGDLPPFVGPLVCLDRDDLSGEPATVPEDLPGGDDLAYVIFTSGSTGRPKGVQIPHRALAAFLDAMNGLLTPGPADRWLAVTTVSFDIAALELYLPLMTGGRVVIASRDAAADGARLVEALADTGATIMQATPVTWTMLAAAGWTGTPGLTALCGGEALSADLADALIARAGAVWNVYGPTETTVWSTARRVDGRREGREAVETLGVALANETAHVLDARMEPVPVGVEGELYIGGVGLARGYIGRPDLTAERFVADPFGPPGACLYRTGDRVRRLSSGDLEFLGRADQQVKIRGFRIELGEIEAALACQPGVGQAAVTVHAAGTERRLAGYVVPADPAAPPVAATLRHALRDRLPDYMVPASFVILDRLPLTPNNKVDRKALPAPGEVSRDDHVPPRDGDEVIVALAWEKVLGRSSIDVRDNFFDLGGHSLLSVALMAEMSRRIGRNLPMSLLFEHPSIERMARAIREQSGRERSTPLVTLRSEGTREPIYAVPGASGNAAAFLELVHSLGRDQPFHAFQAIGLGDGKAPLTDIEEIADRYATAIVDSGFRGSCTLLGHSFGSRVAFAMVAKLKAQGIGVRRLIVIDTIAPVFDAPPVSAGRDEASMYYEYGCVAERFLGRSLDLSLQALRALDEDGQRAYLEDRLRRTGWISEGTASGDFMDAFRVYKAAIHGHYRPAEPLAVPLTLIRGVESLPTLENRPEDAMTAQLEDVLARPDWGWGEVAADGELTVLSSPGNHITILQPPAVDELARLIESIS